MATRDVRAGDIPGSLELGEKSVAPGCVLESYPETVGIVVREQCSCCHREVRETLAGVCFDCLIPL